MAPRIDLDVQAAADGATQGIFERQTDVGIRMMATLELLADRDDAHPPDSGCVSRDDLIYLSDEKIRPVAPNRRPSSTITRISLPARPRLIRWLLRLQATFHRRLKR